METSEYPKAVAAEVRAEIARANLTHTAVADAAGIARATFSRKVNGKTPFDVLELASIAATIGIEPDRFLRPSVESIAAAEAVAA